MKVKFGLVLVYILLYNLTPIQSQRLNQTLNAGWEFHQGDTTIDASWERISLPHTWNAADIYDDERGYFRGIGWYRTVLTFPDSAKNQYHELYFEGVSQEVDLYLNGSWMGHHNGAFSAFNFNISDQINYGAENQLLLKVDNRHNPDIPPFSFDFNLQGGVYRDVRLISSRNTHFEFDGFGGSGVKISTPTVSKETATIEIESNIAFGQPSKSVEIQHSLQYGGKTIATGKTTLKKGTSPILQLSQMEIKNPLLWSPNHPHLYALVSTIRDLKSSKILDEITTPIGFRWFEMNAQEGLFLNGEKIKLIGASRHQDFAKKGTAISDSYQIRDIELLKEMGANFLRTATYAQDPSVLEACDRLGIIVWEEIPVVDRVTPSRAFAENAEQMLKELIHQHRNHPSILIWGFMNEILLGAYHKELSPAEQQETLKATTVLAKHLNQVCKTLDPTRLTAIANQKNFQKYEENGLLTITDIVGWNIYYGWYSSDISRTADFLQEFHEKYPNQGVLISEFGAGSDIRIHSDQPERFDFSMEWQQHVHEEYLKIIQDNDWLIGAAIWNLVDFSSEGRQDAMPNINSKGLLTDDRQYKDVYFLYKSALSNDAVVRIASHDWGIRSATTSENHFTQAIKVYTNQSEVELFQNGQSLGQKVRDSSYFLMWDVPFIHGKNTLYAKSSIGTDDFVSIDFDLIKTPFDNSFQSIHVNCGSHDDFIEHNAHVVWLADQAYKKGSWGYISGEPYKIWNGYRNGSDKNILQTDLDRLYQTQRMGAQKYQFDLPTGVYNVELHFAELESANTDEKLLYNLGNEVEISQEASREFNIFINGQEVIHGLNLTKEYQANTAIVKSFQISVKTNGLAIDFQDLNGKSVINAITIQKIY